LLFCLLTEGPGTFCAGANKGLQLKLDGSDKGLWEDWAAQQRAGWLRVPRAPGMPSDLCLLLSGRTERAAAQDLGRKHFSGSTLSASFAWLSFSE